MPPRTAWRPTAVGCTCRALVRRLYGGRWCSPCSVHWLINCFASIAQCTSAAAGTLDWHCQLAAFPLWSHGRSCTAAGHYGTVQPCARFGLPSGTGGVARVRTACLLASSALLHPSIWHWCHYLPHRLSVQLGTLVSDHNVFVWHMSLDHSLPGCLTPLIK